MPAFNYVSGNPANLVGGGAASMVDIQGPFTDIKAAVNGNLDEFNVPNLTAAFTTYKELRRFSAVINNVAGTYLMQTSHTSVSGVTLSSSGATPIVNAVYLDPTDFNANTRTTKLRLRLTVVPNVTAPGATVTFTAGLYPIATVTSGAGVEPVIATLGTVIAGSTAVVTNPGALSLTATTTGADFNMPAAGLYAVAVVTNAATASGSVNDLIATMEMRQQ